jgi:hypothetical protein
VLTRFEAGHVGLQDVAGVQRLLRAAGLEPTRVRPVWFRLYALVAGVKP